MKSLLVLLALFLSFNTFGQDTNSFPTFEEVAEKARLDFASHGKKFNNPRVNLLEFTLENGTTIPINEIVDFTFTSDRKIDRLDLIRDRVIYGEEIKYGTIIDFDKKPVIIPRDKLKIPNLSRLGKHEGGENGGGG